MQRKSQAQMSSLVHSVSLTNRSQTQKAEEGLSLQKRGASSDPSSTSKYPRNYTVSTWEIQ